MKQKSKKKENFMMSKKLKWTKSGSSKPGQLEIYLGDVKNKTMFFISELDDGTWLLEFSVSKLIQGKTDFELNIIGYYSSLYIAKCTAERFLIKLNKTIS